MDRMRTELKILSLSLLLLCAGSRADGQDITGTWTGNYRVFLGLMQPQKVVVELFLHDDTVLTGASHLYYKNNQYEHYTLVGKFNPADSSFYFREDSTLAVDVGFGGTCLGNYTMELKKSDTVWRLDGRWRPNGGFWGSGGCPASGVWLEKPVPRQPKPKVRDKNLDRASDIQSLIELSDAERDSIKIEVLDNAEIDGDVVSIYFNDSNVVQKQRISATPNTFYLSLSKDLPVCKIHMIAESVGSLPPCTAQMIVTTKEHRYEVMLSSSYSSNAVVELFLKE